jgi:hypothetical protein
MSKRTGARGPRGENMLLTGIVLGFILGWWALELYDFIQERIE